MSTLLNTVWLLHYSIFNPHLVEIHYFLFVHLFCCLFCIDHCNKSNAMKQVAILCSSEINTKYELEWLIVVCRYFLHYANTHIYHRNSMYMLSGAPNFLLQLYVFVWSVYLQLSVRHFAHCCIWAGVALSHEVTHAYVISDISPLYIVVYFALSIQAHFIYLIVA